MGTRDQREKEEKAKRITKPKKQARSMHHASMLHAPYEPNLV